MMRCKFFKSGFLSSTCKHIDVDIDVLTSIISSTKRCPYCEICRYYQEKGDYNEKTDY